MRLPSVCPACASSCEFESTVCESAMGDMQLHDDRRGTRAFVACTVACHALDGLSALARHGSVGALAGAGALQPAPYSARCQSNTAHTNTGASTVTRHQWESCLLPFLPVQGGKNCSQGAYGTSNHSPLSCGDDLARRALIVLAPPLPPPRRKPDAGHTRACHAVISDAQSGLSFDGRRASAAAGATNEAHASATALCDSAPSSPSPRPIDRYLCNASRER